MLRSLAAAALSLGVACAWGASSPATDAQWEGYFNVWAKDQTATPQAVQQFYANRVNYYGHEMTPAEVYQDKLHLIRLWPMRRYQVAPGTVATRERRTERCAATPRWMELVRPGPRRCTGARPPCRSLLSDKTAR